jgi:hypothetical protein
MIYRSSGCRDKFKKANHGLRRDSRSRLVKLADWLLAGFYQSANALGAQQFLYLRTIFHHADGLQIGTKSPASGLLGPGTVPAKRRCLTTMCTLCHVINSFLHDLRLQKRANHCLVNNRAILPQTYSFIKQSSGFNV